MHKAPIQCVMYINTIDRVQWGAFLIYIIFSAAVGDVVRTVNCCTAHTSCTPTLRTSFGHNIDLTIDNIIRYIYIYYYTDRFYYRRAFVIISSIIIVFDDYFFRALKSLQKTKFSNKNHLFFIVIHLLKMFTFLIDNPHF